MYSRSHNEISFVGQILHRFYLQIWLPWFRCQSVPFTIISMYLLYPDSYSRCNNYNRRPPNNYIQTDTLFRYCPCSNLARIAGETILQTPTHQIYAQREIDKFFRSGYNNYYRRLPIFKSEDDNDLNQKFEYQCPRTLGNVI